MWLLACGHLKGSWPKGPELPCGKCVSNIPPDIEPLRKAALTLCPNCRDGRVNAGERINEKIVTLTQAPGQPQQYQHAIDGAWVLCQAAVIHKLVAKVLIPGGENGLFR